MPIFKGHENCNLQGRQCENSGLLIDMMEVWAKDFNFTWDIYAPPDNDWGLFPVSGTGFVIEVNVF